LPAGFQTANNSCKLNIYILAKPVTEQALPARLHGAACEATDWEIPWRTSELATCFMQRKLSPKSKNVACTQKTSIPNATLSLKPTKKSCFCVAIRLKTSQNKKNMQPFTSYQDKSVVLDTPAKIPRLNHPIFPHTVEILYLFGILRINTRVSGMLACRYPCAFISGSGAGIPKRYKISA
jgi:hypothetical protein